jgi:biopolymer transport protein ExbD
MAQIQDTGGGQQKGGKKRAKRGVPTVDMTPMVDLAFLLLTFFVMTSTFSKPKVMSLVYPAKPEGPVTEPPQINNAVTFLLSDDRIFYYQDAFYKEGNDKGKPATQLEETDFSPSGVRKLLTDLNRYVIEKKAGYDDQFKRGEIADSTYKRLLIEAKKSKEALNVLIKTDDMATCKNFIDLIDELKIADIGMIAPVDITAEELDLVKAKTDK